MSEERQTRTIRADELTPEILELVREACQGRIRVIVEDAGQPVAEVLPVTSEEMLATEREEFFALFRKGVEHSNLSEEEADEIAREACDGASTERSSQQTLTIREQEDR